MATAGEFDGVAIVGAGPYGLSLAAHLAAAGVPYRLFGRPMQFWQDHVPHGTCLKSDGKSSDLVDPAGRLSWRAHCLQRRGDFATRRPIPVEEFVDYGRHFQKRLVACSDPRDIVAISRAASGFRLVTEDGESLHAPRVVLAVGINAFRFIPAVFAGLPPGFVSHSAEYGSVAGLAGRRVAVIGSGASAIDVAAVAHEAGADVTIISGREQIAFHEPPGPRRLRDNLRHPDTGIGAGWRNLFYVRAPDAFRLLPDALRLSIVTTALGPSPGWFMKPRIEGRVPILAHERVTRATVAGGRVALALGERSFEADHVVAATGFQVDVQRLGFLDAAITSGIRTVRGAPALSRNFETSLPGLYVIGPAAAASFGPVLRFVHGAGFAVPRIAGHLIRASAAGRVAAGAPAAGAPAAGVPAPPAWAAVP